MMTKSYSPGGPPQVGNSNTKKFSYCEGSRNPTSGSHGDQAKGLGLPREYDLL